MKSYKCYFYPKLVILDEIDSGLDIDAIKIICEGIVNNLSRFCISGNYSLPRILTYLKPTHVHIMINGKKLKRDT
jgi:Fe-S cluster assembly ATP-binding protein